MPEADNDLCEICSAFPWETFFNEEPEVDETSPHRYETFRSYVWDWTHVTVFQATCRTCAFLLEAVRATGDLDGDLPFGMMYITLKRCTRKRYDPLEDEEAEAVEENGAPYPGLIYLHNRKYGQAGDVYDSDESGGYDDRGEFCCFILPVGSDSKPAVENLGYGRYMEPKLSDFSLMKRWIKLCDDNHGDYCTKPMVDFKRARFYNKLRVIDVELDCVCELPEGGRYLALSYCWGGVSQLTLTKETHDEFTAFGALSGNAVCATVRDAMTLTAELGERYLWVVSNDSQECEGLGLPRLSIGISFPRHVPLSDLTQDSLCIIQDHDEDRMHLINNMHLIYHNAYLTIIVADGADCSRGIPGVSYERQKQAVKQTGVEQQSLVSLSDYWGNSMLKSSWNQRGWTLQEKLCSRRTLIMQESKALFQCGEASWDEDVSFEAAPKESTYKGNELQPISRLIDDFQKAKSTPGGQCAIWDALETILERYYSRHLSLKTDILNAFAGIMGMLVTYVGSFHWGLPEQVFHMHLGWIMSTGPAEARIGFPSWSWAGWYGDRNRHSMVHFNSDAIPLLTVQAVKKRGFRRIASTRPDMSNETWKHPHFAYDKDLEKEFHPMLAHRAFPDGTRLSQLLFFSTSSTKLRLGKYIGRHYQDEHRGVYTLEHPKSGRSLRTIESTQFAKHRVSGKVEPPPGISLYCTWVAEHGRLHDYLVIAHGIDPEPWFQLMLVEWDNGIAYRVQVTNQVAVDDWWALEPVQKYVVLG